MCFSLTKAVGLDCEMVGVGPNGRRSALARVSVVPPPDPPVCLHAIYRSPSLLPLVLGSLGFSFLHRISAKDTKRQSGGSQ